MLLKMENIMKLKNIVICFYLLTIGYDSFPQPEDKLKSIDQYDDTTMKLILFCGDYSFVEQWYKPEIPELTTKNSIKRGEDLVPFMVFSSTNVDESGNVSLTYNIKVINPDSTIYFENKNLIVWKDNPAPNLHLVQQFIRIFIEEKDQLGIYTIQVEVLDKNKNISIPLNVKFEVK